MPDGVPGAVDTFVGGAGATVSVAVGAALDVPGVIVPVVAVEVVVDVVAVVAAVDPAGTLVALCAVSVLTDSPRPHAAAMTTRRAAACRRP